MAEGNCTIDGCQMQVYVRGCCRRHYHRLWSYGDPLGGAFRQSTAGKCAVSTCSLGIVARGYCPSHYRRWQRHGDPLMGRPPLLEGTDDDRFWAKVDRDSGDCWTWTGAIAAAGYGTVRYHGKVWSAHRLCYELTVGPIPAGLALDHLCRVRRCVNPRHLEPVTTAENNRRAAAHRRTQLVETAAARTALIPEQP